MVLAFFIFCGRLTGESMTFAIGDLVKFRETMSYGVASFHLFKKDGLYLILDIEDDKESPFLLGSENNLIGPNPQRFYVLSLVNLADNSKGIYLILSKLKAHVENELELVSKSK